MFPSNPPQSEQVACYICCTGIACDGIPPLHHTLPHRAWNKEYCSSGRQVLDIHYIYPSINGCASLPTVLSSGASCNENWSFHLLIFPDRPISDDESLIFHQFFFISAVGAGKWVAFAHKYSILNILLHIWCPLKNLLSGFRLLYRLLLFLWVPIIIPHFPNLHR